MVVYGAMRILYTKHWQNGMKSRAHSVNHIARGCTLICHQTRCNAKL